MEYGNPQQEKHKIKKPIYKKWYFWLIIVLVILVVIVSIFGTQANSNENLDNIPNNGIQGDTDNSSSNESQPEIYYLGEAVTVGSFKYTINSVSNTNVIDTVGGIKSTENNFIRLNITAENIGDTTEYLFTSNMKLMLNGKQYEPSYKSNNLTSSVAPNITRTFWLVFETPTSSTDDDYYFRIQLKSNKLIILKEKV